MTSRLFGVSITTSQSRKKKIERNLEINFHFETQEILCWYFNFFFPTQTEIKIVLRVALEQRFHYHNFTNHSRHLTTFNVQLPWRFFTPPKEFINSPLNFPQQCFPKFSSCFSHHTHAFLQSSFPCFIYLFFAFSCYYRSCYPILSILFYFSFPRL